MKRLTPEEFFEHPSCPVAAMPEEYEHLYELMQAYAEHLEATMEVPNDFQAAMLSEMDKLPYSKHVDDGQYNDGQVMGFQLGAEWAYKNYLEASAWVSVEERLPDNVNSQPVLVLVTDGSIATTGYYLHDRKSWSDYRMKITHWRPLPSPPKSINNE